MIGAIPIHEPAHKTIFGDLDRVCCFDQPVNFLDMESFRQNFSRKDNDLPPGSSLAVM